MIDFFDSFWVLVEFQEQPFSIIIPEEVSAINQDYLVAATVVTASPNHPCLVLVFDCCSTMKTQWNFNQRYLYELYQLNYT